MHYAAWNARLNRPMKTGSSIRENLEEAASRGSKRAIRMLTGPPFPVALRYLWHWHLTLQRGIGRNSFDGSRGDLDWLKFQAWKECTGARPYSHEVAALFDLDLIERNPDVVEKL